MDEASAMPLVLLPGTACDARLFAPMLDRLGDADAIVVSLTGATTAATMAQRILAEAPERFALLGFSLGGIVALEMMAQAPERIAGLALVDTTGRPDPMANAAVRRAAAQKARLDGMDFYIHEAWTSLVSPVHADNAALRETIVAMARDCGPDGLAEQGEVAIARADSRPRLGAIAVPTLVLAGEHEQVCPLAAHRELADGIAGARFFTIPQAGHFAPLENPAVVARHVRDWLDRIPEFRTGRQRRKETA